jgi:hypothetical protein
MLTPEAFKKCLMRAQRRLNQPIDPVVYCDYYLLLEKVFRQFTLYEKLYKDKLLTMKDDNIALLRNEVQDLKLINQDQTSKIDQLLAYGKETTERLDDQNLMIQTMNISW